MRLSFLSLVCLAFAALAVSCIPALASQNGTIRGTVTDAQSGNSLPGANVLIVGTSLGAASDLNGDFVIENVPPGSYTIRTTYVGYTERRTNIKVGPGEELTLVLKLQAVGVQGKEVVVTAQASGQNSAINQQLSSMQIKNVVSAARIRELPDANAAESVGRLPGVSLVRQGGEGSEVVIRGLEPKYNEITIDGVQMAATDPGDRAVDLSMISSNMLQGIEVTKAITPDMDAAVLGGTVNFKLREAGENNAGPAFNLLAQGGYDNLQNKFGDYKFVASGERRLLDDKFGVFAELDIERRNLTSNELGAGYYLNAPVLGNPNPTYLGGLNLDDVLRDRHRYGGTITMDYRIPDGKIDLMNFFSSGITSTQDRGESYGVQGNNHVYSASDSRNYLNVITNLLDIEKSFGGLTLDAKLSHSYSENHDPNDLGYSFIQQNVGLNHSSYWQLNPQFIPPLAKDSLGATYLQGINNSNSFARERDITASLDLKSNVNFTDEISGVLKVGGEYQHRQRSYNYNESDGALIYAGTDIGQAIVDAFPWMSPKVTNPELLPITLFEDPGFKYGKFLGGDYTMGVPTNIGLMWQVLQVIQDYAKTHNVSESWAKNGLLSAVNNYSGDENESAVYAMATINFGPKLTILPGVRFQSLQTSYTAPRIIEQGVSRNNYVYHDTTIDETHGLWLPMIHLNWRPLDWLQIHLAYTNTLTYPDYNTITPKIDVPTGGGTITWNNYALSPAKSTNYDAVLDLYSNSVGLLSFDGFLKHISDLIFPTGTRYVIDPSQYPGIPSSSAGSPISTDINDPYTVDVIGIEGDWQTHFWYLPGPLSGLVLSINYTHIFSSAKYPKTITTFNYTTFTTTYTDTFYTDRLFDQPNDVANLALGYDYRGFSTRVSMIYQSNIFKAQSFYPELRVNTDRYLRWDLSVKQDLPWYGVQAFFDINNINSARDVSLIEGPGYPQAEEHYGMTADLGLRLNL